MYGVTHLSEERKLLKPRIRYAIATYEERTNTRLMQKDLAEKMGITPQYLSAVIAGRKKLDPDLMFKLAKTLDCKVDDLYSYEEE